MDEPEITLDSLVASALQKGSTPGSGGRYRLTLCPQAPPRPTYLPGLGRTVARIDPRLRANLQRLIRAELPWPLFLHGPAGSGKTCAALALLDHCVTGAYVTATELAEQVTQAQQGRLTWQGEPGYAGTLWPEMLWESLSRKKLVVLDELGTRDQSPSDHHYECVKRLLDLRQGKPLIAISNLGLERIEALYDDRIASRLAAGTVIRLDAQDRRLAEERQK